MMKAAVYTRYGNPNVVQIKDVALPTLTSTKVLVRIYATTVNRTDTALRAASNFPTRVFAGLFSPRFNILGCEFSGVIEQVGSAVKQFAAGDKVFGFSGVYFGAHAEYIAIEENAAIAHMPVKYAFERAAALTEGAHYALTNLRAADIKEGQHVLVYGATGAIGSAAVQLAKCLGAKVTAVCAGTHMDIVKALGADEVLDYQKNELETITQRFDYIFDAVGKSSYVACKGLLLKQGIYSSTELGANAQNIFYAFIGHFSSGKKVIFPIPKITREDAKYLAGLAQSGQFRPLIDRHFQLDDISKAHEFVDTGQKVGNVVVKIDV